MGGRPAAWPWPEGWEAPTTGRPKKCLRLPAHCPTAHRWPGRPVSRRCPPGCWPTTWGRRSATTR
eukprot:352640-Alexandrium_andersonii.AAC.1